MRTHDYFSLPKALALAKQKGPRSLLRSVVLPLLTASSLMMGSGAWAAAEIGVDWDDDNVLTDGATDVTDGAAVPPTIGPTSLGETTTGTPVTCDGAIDGVNDLDFGVTPLGTPVLRYFRISNPDTAAVAPGALVGDGDALALLLPDISGVTVPLGFSIGAGHPFNGGTLVADASSAVFPIQLDAAAAGPYAGQFSFAFADDGGATVTKFCFDIVGVVDNVVVPVVGGEIMLQDVTSATAIVDMVDGAAPEVDFASAAAPTSQGTPVDRVFRITNMDPAVALNLSGVAFTNNECTITTALPNQDLVALGTIDFTVRFKATNAGTLDPVTGLVAPVKCEMIIANSDADEGPFNTILNGYVAAIVTPVVNADIQVWENTVSTTEVFDGVAPTAFLPTFSGTSVSRNFVIKNIGTADLDLNSITINGVNASSFNWAPVTVPFPDFLTPNATATLSVTFTPATVGSFSANLQIFNNALLTNENPFDILLSGTAMSATKEIQVFDGTTDIVKGSTISLTTAPGGVVGTPITKIFTVKNIGGTQLKIDSTQLKIDSAGGTGLKLSNLAATTLDAAGGAKDNLTFTATLEATTPGEFTGTVSIANDDTDENPFTFNLTGTVMSSLTSPEVMVWEVLKDGSPKEITDEQTEIVDFTAAINTPMSKIFKVKNIGGVVLDLTALSPLPKGFSLVGMFPTDVQPGETVQFEVKLNTSTVGAYGGTAEFFSTDVDENPFSFPIGASVDVPAPEIEVLDGTTSITSGTTVPVEFGPTGVGSSVSKIFTVKNTGEADLNLTNMVTFKDGGTGFTIGSFNPGPIAKGAFTTFTVILNASSSGTYTGTITFGNDDKDENPYTFPIKGVVDTTAPVTEEIEVWDGSPQEITAGTAIPIPDGDTNKVEFPTGTPSVQTFTVKNLGSEVLTLYSLRLPVGFSLQKGVTLSTVAPQQQVSFDVLLDATTDGVYEGSLELFNSDTDETPYDFPLHGIVGNPSAGTDLTVTVVGNGSVTSSSASGINACTSAAEASCTAKFPAGDVTLTATPTNATDTVAWSNGCTDLGNNTGKVTIVAGTPATCTATISAVTPPPTGTDLTVTVIGNGNVTSTPAGITCTSAAPCTAKFQAGTVTLTAAPTNATDTVAWGASCTGTGNTGTVTIVAGTPVACTATISGGVTPPPTGTDLTVTVIGNGNVTSTPAGITCTSATPCTTKFPAGAVTLTATPTNATDTVAWSAGCTGTGNTGTVTIVAGTAATCTATISGSVTPPPTKVELKVTVSGNGTVTKTPAGEACATSSTNCSAYAVGTSVTLTANSLATNTTFTSWGGDCSSAGTGNPASVTMSVAKNCTATFTTTITPPPPPSSPQLTVTVSGNGTVTSDSGGINCGTACSASYTSGSIVRLTATPSTGATFTSWGGSCTGTSASTVVSMDAAKSCTATFSTGGSTGGEVDVNVTNCFNNNNGIYAGSACLTADKLLPGAVDANGNGVNVTVSMKGGISKSGGPYLKESTVVLADPIATRGIIQVDPADVGKKVELIVAGIHYSTIYPRGFEWYMLDGCNTCVAVLAYNDRDAVPMLSELTALKTVDALAAIQVVDMYSGNFVFPGFLDIFYGYRVVGSGKIVFNLDPIKVTINP